MDLAEALREIGGRLAPAGVADPRREAITTPASTIP